MIGAFVCRSVGRIREVSVCDIVANLGTGKLDILFFMLVCIVTMYIRKSVRKYKDKEYVNYVLVESVWTPKGPRQKAICSLGSLEPGPPEKWERILSKAAKRLSGQRELFEDETDAEVDWIVEKARETEARRARRRPVSRDENAVSVDTGCVEVEAPRELGTVHVGEQFYEKLGIDEVLSDIGLSEQTRLLTKVMVLNRLIYPLSEHSMPGWVGRTALEDLLGEDVCWLNDDQLYRNMDRLYPARKKIESRLAARERE